MQANYEFTHIRVYEPSAYQVEKAKQAAQLSPDLFGARHTSGSLFVDKLFLELYNVDSLGRTGPDLQYGSSGSIALYHFGKSMQADCGQDTPINELIEPRTAVGVAKTFVEGTGIRVAIVDTEFLLNTSIVPSASIVLGPSSNPLDSHGTKSLSMFVGQPGSIAPDVSLYLASIGQNSRPACVVLGMLWAAMQAVEIIAVSYWLPTDSKGITKIIADRLLNYCTAQKCQVFAATGNDNPSSSALTLVGKGIAVGGTRKSGLLWLDYQDGAPDFHTDCVAQGYGVASTNNLTSMPKMEYCGSSLSTQLVAACYALHLQHRFFETNFAHAPDLEKVTFLSLHCQPKSGQKWGRGCFQFDVSKYGET
jgi:hypothetical protein